MKLLYIFLAFSLIFISCQEKSPIIVLDNGKTINTLMVGTFVGSEKGNQNEALEKEWKAIRKVDGTFSMDFKLRQNGNSFNITEVGTWWVEGDKFYEIKKGALYPDVYIFEFISDDQIRFKSKELNTEFENKDYEFIDTRVQ